MSSIPRFSIIYASCRPKEMVAHYAMWTKQTKVLKNCEFIFAVDELDPASIKVAEEIQAKDYSLWHGIKVCIVPAPSRNCIVAWNTAAKIANGYVYMVTSDDFTIPPGWDETFTQLKCSCYQEGKIKEPSFWWEHPHVVHTNDGHTSVRHGICTFPIITRGWYEITKYIYHPSYTELFGDQELCEVGYKKKVMITAVDLMIEHRHYTVHKRGFDEHDERHSTREAWNKDEANFLRRRKYDFPTCVEHTCHCGTATQVPHDTGKNGCVRHLVEPPTKFGENWIVNNHELTDFSLRDQRGYHQHPCGCWSRSPDSTNSIEA